MNRRKVLIVTTFAVIVFGVIMAMTPFVGSLKPSARSDAELPRFDVSRVRVGELSILDGPNLGEVFNGYDLKLLSYKSVNGELKVWRVPAKDGLVGMPDLHWWKPIHACTQLEIIEENNKPMIACLDPEVSDWWLGEWKWDLNGGNLGKMVDDLEPVKGVVEGRYFVYAKSS